ncbi:MAG: 16S rRNA (cytosine(1402)-N(4))-methyltransferase RsmH [Proteobacteria bacterium]|nr:16S rRNA (cytosine(1402)-N(4))-methyltransferase RsmH [Pseudomonadota bacterium]MBU1741555.1 16S rRNA (cytosine(1402)-N(4))-methyltransferase RsmH [Pseudomonadota bacterium]
MLDEVLDLFGKHRKVLVDGTLGGGSHAAALLSVSPSRRVIGLDRDPAAIRAVSDRLRGFGERFNAVQASFADLAGVLDNLGLDVVDGILLDLGFSSTQLEDPTRGFSFQTDGPLDMRLDQSQGPTAAEVLARATERELADLIFRLGEEPRARMVARAIVAERRSRPIKTTGHLAEVVSRALPPRRPGQKAIHPATRTFMALRIEVNDELGHLRRFLEGAPGWLSPGGRLVVVSFHSLEDRLVKRAIRTWEKGCVCPPRQPVCTCGRRPTMKPLSRRVLRPGPAETAANPRSRSARLRAAEKI